VPEDWETEGDICENRHRGNPESALAFVNNAASWSAERERIYQWFVDRGPAGDTREACLIALGIADPDGKAGKAIQDSRAKISPVCWPFAECRR
jgi:hypothetical protein